MKLDVKKLTALARKAQAKAYCPYSDHPVGAVIVAGSGKVYAGCNCETAHYKGICAEASAISAMVLAGERKIRAVVVIGPKSDILCTPCGDCRQRIREFATKDAVIYSMYGDGRQGAVHGIDDLLPLSFGPENVTAVKEKKKSK